MDLVSLIVILLIIAVVIGAVKAMPLPSPLDWVMPLIVAIVLIAWLLGGIPHLRLR